MSVVVVEGQDRFFLGARATLIENDREVANEWAAKHVVSNPAYAWVLGKFVEADRANKNKQYFPLDELQMARPSITNAPMNINHNTRRVVGSFVATEMVYPTTEEADEEPLNPYIENLGVFWKFYFPEEYREVQLANAEGGLFYSMEAIPESISTIGGSDDEKLYPYEGRTSENYPDEINNREVEALVLHKPHFTAGALILPPEKPGWSRADARQIAGLMKERMHEAELAYEGIKSAFPHLDADDWEGMMAELLVVAGSDSNSDPGSTGEKFN